MSTRLFDKQLFEERMGALWGNPSVPDPAADVDSTVFRILAVCTGNVARSPVIERLLQAELDAVGPGRFQVTSAGVRAVVGSVMAKESRRVIAQHGGNPHGFRARQLSQEALRGIDLVLTASREHTVAVLDFDPRFLLKTFSLRELARTASATSADSHFSRGGVDPHDFVRRASVLRQSLRRESIYDDVEDPFGRGAEAYEVMSRQVVPSVRQLASVLAGVVGVVS
jgi:protein-tyrosine phosphatase